MEHAEFTVLRCRRGQRVLRDGGLEGEGRLGFVGGDGDFRGRRVRAGELRDVLEEPGGNLAGEGDLFGFGEAAEAEGDDVVGHCRGRGFWGVAIPKQARSIPKKSGRIVG